MHNKKTMPEENVNPTWVAQTSQTSQWSWSQTWDDFVIDFWEWEVVDQQTESKVDDNNQDSMDDFSQWDNLANQDNEIAEEWKQDDILLDDDLFGWSESDAEDTNHEDDFLWENLTIQNEESEDVDEDFSDGAVMGLNQDDASLGENNEIDGESNSESELFSENEEQEPIFNEQENLLENEETQEDNESSDELSNYDEISTSDEKSDTFLSEWNEEDGGVEDNELAEDDEYSNPFENVDMDAPLAEGENFGSDLNDDAQFDDDLDRGSDFESNVESDVESENMSKENDEMVDQNLYENDIDDSNYVQEESDINENESTDFMEDINLDDNIDSEIVDNSEESIEDDVSDGFPSEEVDFDENRFENTEDNSEDDVEDDAENNYDNQPIEEEFMQNEGDVDSVDWELPNSEFDNQTDENSNIQSEVDDYWNESSEDINDEPQISDIEHSEVDSLDMAWLEQTMDMQWDQNVNNESDLDSQSSVSMESELNDQSEPSISYEMNADLINQNEENTDTNVVETTSPSIPETTDSVENVSEWQAVQSVLSLDQILDSELQMNGQPTTTTPSQWWNSASSKWSILPIAIWAGVLALAAVVVLMAFPTLLSGGGSVSWEEMDAAHWSAEGIIWEQTVIEDEIQEYNPTDIETGEVFTSEDEYEPYFPTPIESEEDTNLGGWDEIDYQYQPAWNINTDAKPYSAGNVEYFDEESGDDEMISEDEILSVISSFKSQGEQYYKSGQERADREIIIYASKIIYLCDEYNSRVLAKEWLDMESFENFNTSVQDVIKKINSVYNANDTDTTLVQNDFNPEDTNFDWKDQIREYIQNR